MDARSTTLPYTRIRVRATLDRVETDAATTLKALQRIGYTLHSKSQVRQETHPWEREGTIDLALIPPGRH